MDSSRDRVKLITSKSLRPSVVSDLPPQLIKKVTKLEGDLKTNQMIIHSLEYLESSSRIFIKRVVPSYNENSHHNDMRPLSSENALTELKKLVNHTIDQYPILKTDFSSEKVVDIDSLGRIILSTLEKYQTEADVIRGNLFCFTTSLDKKNPNQNTTLGVINSNSNFSENMFHCTISQTVTRSILNRPYTEYIIGVSTPTLFWNIERRYGDFIDFDRKLRKYAFASGNKNNWMSKLTKLPPKRLLKMKDEVIAERKQTLDSYLSTVCSIPQASSSIPFFTFIGVIENLDESKDKTSLSQSHLSSLRIISLDTMIQVIEPGDLILFNTRSIASSLQRSITKSSYDHVGIVIRDPPYSSHSSSFYILESTMEGVLMHPLRKRLRLWDKGKSKIVFRTLSNCERSIEFCRKLCQFACSVDGLEYGLSVSEFCTHYYRAKKEEKEKELRQSDKDNNKSLEKDIDQCVAIARNVTQKQARSGVFSINYSTNIDKNRDMISDREWNNGININRKNEKEKEYFCSELIARALVEVGLLPINTDCLTMLPVNFSVDKNETLKLVGGAYYGPEILIRFNSAEVVSASEKMGKRIK